MMVLDDLTAVKAMIGESHKLIRAVERKLRIGSQISRFPALAVARARAADFETQMLSLQGDLSSHMRDLVLSLLSATDRAELDRLQKLRKKLAAELKKLPKSTDGYSTRVKKMRGLIDQIDSNALAIQLEIKNLENMLKSIEAYYYRTIKTQRVPKAVMQRNLDAVKKQVTVLKGLVKGLREDLADNRNNLGIGDSVMAYEKKLRAQYAAVLTREQQLTAAAAANLTPDKAARKARIDSLLVRIQRADSNLKGVNQRIDGYLAAKRGEILRVLAEEKAKLAGYRQQVALYAPSSKEVVGGVALQNFRKVSQMVQGVLVKADVGVLDVVWAIKNLAKGQYEKKESLFMRAMEALKLKYREPRGCRNEVATHGRVRAHYPRPGLLQRPGRLRARALPGREALLRSGAGAPAWSEGGSPHLQARRGDLQQHRAAPHRAGLPQREGAARTQVPQEPGGGLPQRPVAAAGSHQGV